MNEFHLDEIVFNENIISYRYRVQGEWKKYFRVEDNWRDASKVWNNSHPEFEWLYCEYDCNMEEIPYSVAVIPLLATILPLTWLFDGKIFVEQIDFHFFYAIDNIRRGFFNFTKDWRFNRPQHLVNSGGGIIHGLVIRNDIALENSSPLVLFSGGLDSWDAMCDSYKMKPILVPVWGADINSNNSSGWSVVREECYDVGTKHDIYVSPIRSNFRAVLNTHNIGKSLRSRLSNFRDYWTTIMHGLALVGLCAPLAYAKKSPSVFISSTARLDYVVNSHYGSNPFIDESVKFFGVSVSHKSIAKNRNDKVRNVVLFKRNISNYPTLFVRACFANSKGVNCCICEKCLRTWMAFLIEQENPSEYGFYLTAENVAIVLKHLIAKKYKFSSWAWRETLEIVNRNYDLLVQYLNKTEDFANLRESLCQILQVLFNLKIEVDEIGTVQLAAKRFKRIITKLDRLEKPNSIITENKKLRHSIDRLRKKLKKSESELASLKGSFSYRILSKIKKGMPK